MSPTDTPSAPAQPLTPPGEAGAASTLASGARVDREGGGRGGTTAARARAPSVRLTAPIAKASPGRKPSFHAHPFAEAALAAVELAFARPVQGADDFHGPGGVLPAKPTRAWSAWSPVQRAQATTGKGKKAAKKEREKAGAASTLPLPLPLPPPPHDDGFFFLPAAFGGDSSAALTSAAAADALWVPAEAEGEAQAPHVAADEAMLSLWEGGLGDGEALGAVLAGWMEEVAENTRRAR